MADPRYKQNTYVGTPMTHQQVLNARLEQFCNDHAASYGWTYLRLNNQYQLPVYHKDGVELMRHPEEACWLLQYLGECYRSECHISEISANLETIKIKIEMELSNKQFTADIERLAA